MLINKNDNTTEHVKFVSYTGDYPNLCSGTLTLEIDGQNYTFGVGGCFTDFDSFWVSGGGITANYTSYCEEWEIDVNELPEQFRKYAAEIDDVFNSNVEWGCCGGCI